MPVHERRYFLSLYTKEHVKRQEQLEEIQEQSKTKNGSKGNRTTRISGDALKTRMKSGDIPLT